jgi:hypothetical protein
MQLKRQIAALAIQTGGIVGIVALLALAGVSFGMKLNLEVWVNQPPSANMVEESPAAPQLKSVELR